MLKRLVCMAAALFAIMTAQNADAESIADIEVGSALNIAQQQENITAQITLEAPAETEWNFEYKITDYYGRHIYGAKSEIPAGENSCTVNTGVSGVGWYTMTVIRGENSVSEDFAVVYNSSQRQAYEDTPFAADFAGQGIIKDDQLLEEYSKAVKLAGIDWVRERFYWAQTEPSQGTYDFSGFDRGIDIISGEGLKILNMVPDYPQWATDGGIIPTDLLSVYNSFKSFAEHYDGKVYGWEIGNEADMKTVSADAYTSVVKAALSGIEASGADACKLFGGFALSPQVTDFSEICLRNDLMEYSDCYNIHTHKTDSGSSPQEIQYQTLQAHSRQLFGYEKQDTPLWITESGIYMDVSLNDGQMTDEQKKRQAEYVVTSAARSLAEGTDKHFWFVIPSYIEAGRELGVFSPSHTPNPAYCAQSVMTYMLGQAKYRGELAALPQGVEGYLFDRGGQDAAVVWSESSKYIQLRTDEPIITADIMGNETYKTPLNGYVRLKITAEPMYILFESRCIGINYYPEQTNNAQMSQKSYSDENKVVLAAYFEDTNTDASHKDGYVFSEGKDKEITLYVYNLSDKDISGTIVSENSYGFETSFEDSHVELAAYSRAEVKGVVRNTENAVAGKSEFLNYRILLDNGCYTTSVSPQAVLEDSSPIENVIEFDNAKAAGKWELNHAASGTKAAAVNTADNVVEFTADFSDASARWFYPIFSIDEKLTDENSSGIIFTVTSNEDQPDSDMNVFIYFSDGRVYFAGNDANLSLVAGKRTILLNWDKFILYDSPLEEWADTRPFDPALITRIAVGVTASTDSVTYSLRGIGAYYKNTGSAASDDPVTITPSEDQVYRTSELESVKVYISDEIEPELTEVYVNENLYGEYGSQKKVILIHPAFESDNEIINIFVKVYASDGNIYIKQASYKANDNYYW